MSSTKLPQIATNTTFTLGFVSKRISFQNVCVFFPAYSFRMAFGVLDCVWSVPFDEFSVHYIRDRRDSMVERSTASQFQEKPRERRGEWKGVL